MILGHSHPSQGFFFLICKLIELMCLLFKPPVSAGTFSLPEIESQCNLWGVWGEVYLLGDHYLGLNYGWVLSIVQKGEAVNLGSHRELVAEPA